MTTPTLEQSLKTCTKCKSQKPIAEFSFRKRSVGQRCSWCQPCMRAHNMQRYYKHHEYYRAHHKELTGKSRNLKAKRVFKYLLEHACVDCGETDPIVLEFDHRDGEEKDRTVAELVSDNCGWAKILAEIEKCDVRCANCHRRKTAIRHGYSRTLFSSASE
jgi:hypothetical protein